MKKNTKNNSRRNDSDLIPVSFDMDSDSDSNTDPDSGSTSSYEEVLLSSMRIMNSVTKKKSAVAKPPVPNILTSVNKVSGYSSSSQITRIEKSAPHPFSSPDGRPTESRVEFIKHILDGNKLQPMIDFDNHIIDPEYDRLNKKTMDVRKLFDSMNDRSRYLENYFFQVMPKISLHDQVNLYYHGKLRQIYKITRKGKSVVYRMVKKSPLLQDQRK